MSKNQCDKDKETKDQKSEKVFYIERKILDYFKDCISDTYKNESNNEIQKE